MKILRNFFRATAANIGSGDDSALTSLQQLAQRLARLEISFATASAAKRVQCPVQDDLEDRAPTITDLLTQLPNLKVTSDGRVDLAGSDRALMAMLEANAEISSRLVLRGISALGNLFAHVGPDIKTGAVTADDVEAIGSLLAELGELTGMLLTLRSNCYLVDRR